MRRHDLLRLAPEAWEGPMGAGDHPVLRRWRDAGWPVMRRRGAASEGTVPVALSAAPDGPRRYAFLVAAASVRAVSPPPSLGAVLSGGALPSALRPLAAAVLRAAAESGVDAPRVFGSVMWRHVTGLDAVGPGSDLDCLWDGVEAARLPRLLRALRRVPGRERLDGEIVVGGVGAVSWRELARSAEWGALLVRDEGGARLVARAAVLGEGG